MRRNERFNLVITPLLAGLIVGVLSLLATVQFATAAPPQQTDTDTEAEPTTEYYTAQECQECHLDVTNHWQDSPHAHAYDDPVFQERWIGLGEPSECLSCHTTNFQPASGEYEIAGISCESCHGSVSKEHPPEPVPIQADTAYCGTCHTTTLGEWRLTGHSSADIGCSDCHDPHSQGALFENPDDMCVNCHGDTMGEYLEGTHEEQDIGCVDCHALVIPPEEEPIDGIVPTGHAFTITPGTCVACHTDDLHAGFHLPGYEHGATAAIAVKNGDVSTEDIQADEAEAAAEAAVAPLTPEQQIQALEAAIASNNVTLLFQGGVVGLVLGGTTAWFVANNVRNRRAAEEEEAEEQEDDE